MPHVNERKNIIVAAHGNSLRALVMELDNLSPKEIVKLEIPTGIPIFYEISSSGSIENKKIL